MLLRYGASHVLEACRVQFVHLRFKQLQVYENFGWKLDAGTNDIVIVFAFGAALRLCAFGAMVFMNSDKKR